MWLGKNIDLRAQALVHEELGLMNSSGWCRGPAKTNTPDCMVKGSIVVVDVINGDGAVLGVIVDLSA